MIYFDWLDMYEVFFILFYFFKDFYFDITWSSHSPVCGWHLGLVGRNIFNLG